MKNSSGTTVTDADKAALEELLDKATTDALIVLHQKILENPKVRDSVEFPEIDRPKRRFVHQVSRDVHQRSTCVPY
jgi:hypothetical protein